MTGDAVSRIDKRFADLKAKGRAGLVTFITAGDPDHETCARLLAQLPVAGADVIELGMPFSDPMADGPSIEAAGLRALANGASMKTTLKLVTDFRKTDNDTPIVLMGYFNPISAYGVDKFLVDAKSAGVDVIHDSRRLADKRVHIEVTRLRPKPRQQSLSEKNRCTD